MNVRRRTGENDIQEQTSVDNVAFMEVVDGTEHLPNRLRGILLREFAVLADPVKEFSTGGQLGDNVIFVLQKRR